MLKHNGGQCYQPRHLIWQSKLTLCFILLDTIVAILICFGRGMVLMSASFVKHSLTVTIVVTLRRSLSLLQQRCHTKDK